MGNPAWLSNFEARGVLLLLATSPHFPPAPSLNAHGLPWRYRDRTERRIFAADFTAWMISGYAPQRQRLPER